MINEIEKIRTQLDDVETAYYGAREEYYTMKKDMFINTNWSKINEEREVDGLDKLTSEKKREYYIDIQLQKKHEKYKLLELEYNALKRLYEFKMEQYIKS